MKDLKFTPIPEFLEPLTKREYFAGLAMQSIASTRNEYRETIAEAAVRMADVLIEELNKPKK